MASGRSDINSRRRIVTTQTEFTKSHAQNEEDVLTKTIVKSTSVSSDDPLFLKSTGQTPASAFSSRYHRSTKSYRRFSRDTDANSLLEEESKWSFDLRINGLSLAIFRFVFGCCMIWHVYGLLERGTLTTFFGDGFPETNFGCLPFIKKPSQFVLQYIMWITIMSSCLIAIGFLYKISSLCFLVLYTYLHLLDKSLYSNHHYLYILIAFLLLVTNSNEVCSVDSLLKRCFYAENTQRLVSAWQAWILKFQFVVCYFFVGIAMLNPDWVIRGEPIRSSTAKELAAMFDFTKTHIEQKVMEIILGHVISNLCLMFYLVIGWMLLTRTTRPLAIIINTVFYGLYIYRNGLQPFPCIMVASNLLFLEPDTISNWLQSLKNKLNGQRSKMEGYSISVRPTTPLAKFFVFLYIFAQLLIPLRHLIIPGDVMWTHEGKRFSWRVQEIVKEETLLKLVVEREGKMEEFKNFRLNPIQMRAMLDDPSILPQYAKHIRTVNKGVKKVSAEAWRSVNFRPFSRLVKTDYDLTKSHDLVLHYDWLMPQVDDSHIDFKDIRVFAENMKNEGYSTSVFMELEKKVVELTIGSGACKKVQIAPLKGQIELSTKSVKKEKLHPGTKMDVPIGDSHTITTGAEPATWAYVYECTEQQFYSALGMVHSRW